MLQYFDFSINKSSTCDLTICNLIDTQSAPAAGDEITHNLLVPATQTSDISVISSIEVEKFNPCDTRFSPIKFDIVPINEDAGTTTYVTIAGLFGNPDGEYINHAYSFSTYEYQHLEKITCTITRSGSTIYEGELLPDVDLTQSGNARFLLKEGTIGATPTLVASNDVVLIKHVYKNGVVSTINCTIGSFVGSTMGDPSTINYITMILDHSKVYELDNNDCLKLTTDLDSFGDWDGIWAVKLKVNYLDTSGNDRYIITTRCAHVNCDSECDAVKTISSLLTTNVDQATELALVKQSLDWMMECSDCCAACDALYVYNNRIKGNCKSC